ncbi:MAG: cytochrome oxidase subunit III [Cytophagia bacterium]|nr:MAG: cytochrome oxidase subunit III [Cytophagales bacterium]TAG06949.1 MAG: cytochrome oxidase subunit III [Cytophagia bacterium]TAG44091.1 MAG: cytochrome oxidase subunit III [Cytophagia bacterium]TAH30018.1 MAG: cytochrome oxidase subunit III [Cytophagales bacterium]
MKIDKLNRPSNNTITQQNKGVALSMHPRKFALWLFIVSVCMMFAALTSAYIVKFTEGQPLVYDIPIMFWITSVVIVISSVTMHLAYKAAKNSNIQQIKTFMLITTILGTVFLVGQWYAWVELVQAGVFFAGSKSAPTGSFIYVFSGVHGLHIISGLVFLLITLRLAFKNKIDAQNTNTIEMCATYWHFLDMLWIYLFIFLLLNH